MTNWIKTYWKELLVFGTIFGALLIAVAPDMTWMNTDSDGIHYVYSAKYLYPAHKTSAPLFLLLGNLFLRIPLGAEFWRMSLMSVVASTASAIFIYLIIKEKLGEKSRLYALIGSLVFGGSALVISQSTIVESYALLTMFGIGAFYFAIKGQWMRCALMLGAGGAVHHLIGITIVILLIFYKSLRQWKYIGIMASFLLFYLYIPITVAVSNPPDMWGNTTLGSFSNDNISTALMLIGGLSIWDIPKRIFDTIGILGVSLGLAIIPITWMLFATNIKKLSREPLVWLYLLPIIYFATNLAPQTYVYMMPAIAFGAILAGIYLPKIKQYWKWLILSSAIGLLIFNTYSMDIGRTLDPELSASIYYNELDKIPDGEIIIPQSDWGWAAVFSYNKEYDRSIIPISRGTLPSPVYQTSLANQGIVLEGYPFEPLSRQSALIAQSIVRYNENVWTTKVTTPETYGVIIIPTEGNIELFEVPTVKEVEEMTTPSIQWKPSNPYGFITGAIEVEEWVWIVYSNYNARTFIMLGIIGIVPCWIGYMFIVKRRKWSLKKTLKQEVSTNV